MKQDFQFSSNLVTVNRLNENVCNSKEKWNHDECRCEFKQLDDWSSCRNVYCMWRPSTCDCKCNKECKFNEY